MTPDTHDIAQRAPALDAAYRSGNLAKVRELLDDPCDFPNCRQPMALGCGDYPIEYAIYWSPARLIHEFIALGAEVDYPAEDGFPCLIALLSTDREDKYILLDLFLDAGADIHQRGFNDWTPLHYAVAQKDLKAVIYLLNRGADPHLKTRIDDFSSPLEDAENIGFYESIDALKRASTSDV
ncbi:MAG: ankyrin repeat domain-containing protein [Proteobacteria bacterium]|nr:ankyrin repeat domain-containing protein [Pseudomonadota bacterium]